MGADGWMLDSSRDEPGTSEVGENTSPDPTKGTAAARSRARRPSSEASIHPSAPLDERSAPRLGTAPDEHDGGADDEPVLEGWRGSGIDEFGAFELPFEAAPPSPPTRDCAGPNDATSWVERSNVSTSPAPCPAPREPRPTWRRLSSEGPGRGDRPRRRHASLAATGPHALPRLGNSPLAPSLHRPAFSETAHEKTGPLRGEHKKVWRLTRNW